MRHKKTEVVTYCCFTFIAYYSMLQNILALSGDLMFHHWLFRHPDSNLAQAERHYLKSMWEVWSRAVNQVFDGRLWFGLMPKS